MYETEQPNLCLECPLVDIVKTDESTPFAAIPEVFGLKLYTKV